MEYAAKALIATTVLMVAASGPVSATTGREVYQSVCQACHASGASGAPRLGDKKAWAPRLAKGIDALTRSALDGIPGTAMLPRGTCGTCSDAELRKAVEFMVEQAK